MLQRGSDDDDKDWTDYGELNYISTPKLIHIVIIIKPGYSLVMNPITFVTSMGTLQIPQNKGKPYHMHQSWLCGERPLHNWA